MVDATRACVDGGFLDVIFPVIGSCICTTTAHPSPDLAAYNLAARMKRAELVTALREMLGARRVADLGKVKETRAVRQWAEGTRTIGNDTDVERLRIAYRAAKLITACDTAAVAQAWFKGLNPILDGTVALIQRNSGAIGLEHMAMYPVGIVYDSGCNPARGDFLPGRALTSCGQRGGGSCCEPTSE